MPKWLVPALIWGGSGLAVIFAIALIWVGRTASAPAEGSDIAPSAAPVTLYWVLLIVGLVAAAAGFVTKRRQRKTPLPAV